MNTNRPVAKGFLQTAPQTHVNHFALDTRPCKILDPPLKYLLCIQQLRAKMPSNTWTYTVTPKTLQITPAHFLQMKYVLCKYMKTN